jgi:hypothetical protein
MYNFNYEYITFLYFVHVYMFCNVVLYCIALPARVLFAIKIIIIIDILQFYIPVTGCVGMGGPTKQRQLESTRNK